MPKAPVDEDGDTGPREHDVGSHTYAVGAQKQILPKAEAPSMQQGPQPDFGLRVSPTVAHAHRGGSRTRWLWVGHLDATTQLHGSARYLSHAAPVTRAPAASAVIGSLHASMRALIHDREPHGMSTPAFAPSDDKREVVSRLAAMVGISEGNLGPGKKERKQLIEDVAAYLGLTVDISASKPALLREMIEGLGGEWLPTYASRGDSLSVAGLDRLLELSLRRRPTRGRDLITRNARPEKEAERIIEVCRPVLRTTLSMKQTVLRMQGSDHRQWAQDEWWAFYIEFRLRQRCLAGLGGTAGRMYGNTRFDYELLRPWDFKSHVVRGGARAWMPLNDRGAMDWCLQNTGGIGFIVVSGAAEMAEGETLRAWFNDRRETAGKRKVSSTGRGSQRVLKARFTPTHIDALWLTTRSVRQGQDDGWLANFAQGRQKAGASRAPKYKLDLNHPRLDSVRVFHTTL